MVEGPASTRGLRHTTGTEDVLSVCMILLEQHPEVPVRERLRLSNRIVAEYIEGRRPLIPRNP